MSNKEVSEVTIYALYRGVKQLVDLMVDGDACSANYYRTRKAAEDAILNGGEDSSSNVLIELKIKALGKMKVVFVPDEPTPPPIPKKKPKVKKEDKTVVDSIAEMREELGT